MPVKSYLRNGMVYNQTANEEDERPGLPMRTQGS